MTLTLSLELPPYVHAKWTESGVDPAPEGFALWSPGDGREPPALGDLIMVGRWGAAVVTGYFVEGDYLGVRSSLLAPGPEWFHGRQPGSEHNLCTFGPEFTPAEPPATPEAVAITWRQHPSGPAFRIYGAPPQEKHARAIDAAIKAGGFEYDGHHACRVASKYKHGEANAYALAARLRWAGFAVTHTGFYGDAGPPSAGLTKWWKDETGA